MGYVNTDNLSHKPRWTPYQAVKYAVGEVNHPDQWYGMLCDHFVTYCYGYAGSGYASAIQHWYYTPYSYRHPDIQNAPAGALIFWSIGSYGHVALSLGNGKIASNDIRVNGRISVVPVGEIQGSWGAHPLGWTNPYMAASWGFNPHDPGPKAPLTNKNPLVNLHNLAPKKENNDVLIVQRALAKEVGLDFGSHKGYFGANTQQAYSKWQIKCGFHGKDANGVPGITSLTTLGKRHGFRVAK